MTAVDADLAPSFEHAAFFYGDDAHYVDAVVAFVEEGVERGEPVLVAVPEVRLRLLRDRLSRHLPQVRLAAMDDMGANPAWIIPEWLDFVETHLRAGRTSRGVGEPIWASRTPEELVECQRHEELLNLALQDAPGFRLLCPYDTRALPDDVLTTARRSHPHHGAPALCTNPEFSSTIAPRLDTPLPAVPPWAQRASFAGTADIAPVRQLVIDAAALGGMAQARLGDLAVAVSEALANSVSHGGGRGQLDYWRADDRFVCEVRDRGVIDDPLAGRIRPHIEQPDGRGLWLIHQLCDLVQVRALPGGHQAVRLHVRY